MLSVFQSRQGRQGVALGASAIFSLILTASVGFWYGAHSQPGGLSLDLNTVSTAASGTNMAVATGQISDESEGVFFLDFLTGDLQCLVYYPRQGAFGARYYTNVQAQMPGSGKSTQYLMVTGNAISARTSSNVKPANCLVYVTDVNSGMFAAYAVPWNKTAESSSQMQGGPLLFVGGGPIRNYQVADVGKKPGQGGGGAPAAKPGANNPAAGGANQLNGAGADPIAVPGAGGGNPGAPDPNAPGANPGAKPKGKNGKPT